MTLDPNLAPGAIPLRARNLAPHEGEILVGHVPYGLTAVVGENEEGKSRLLSAVVAIPLTVSRPEALVTMTRGTTEASVGLGAQELRIEERSVGGVAKRRAIRSGEGAPVAELPDPIELMISGGGHVSADANWRARLKSLLEFAPQGVTEEALSQLAGALPSPDDDIAVEVSNRHSASPFGSLLDAADYLADGRGGLLHIRKRTALEDAAAVGVRIDRLHGSIAQIREEARAASGLGGDELVRVLRDGGAPAADMQARLSAVHVARTVLAERLDYRERTRRKRAELREAFGECPSADAAQAAKQQADRLLEAARGELLAARGVLGNLVGARTAREPQAAPLKSRLESAWRDVYVEWIALSGVDDRDVRSPWQPAPSTPTHICKVRAALDRLEAVVAEWEVCREAWETLEEQIAAAQSALAAAEEAAEMAEVRAADAAAHSSMAEGNVRRWQESSRALSEPLPAILLGTADWEPWHVAMPERLEALRAAVDRCESEEALADTEREMILGLADQAIAEISPLAKAIAFTSRHLGLEGELAELQEEQRAHQDRAERLEADAKAVWDRMASVVSEGLKSEFVRVAAGRRIEVRLDSGRWVDVADNVELSKGRLRRAFLDFFLERSGDTEQTVVVSDDVMLPIGEDGRKALSRRAAAKRIRILFEQPRLGGEAPGLHLVWYGGAEGGSK